MMERIGDIAYYLSLLFGVFMAFMAGYAEALSPRPHLDRAAIFGAVVLLGSWLLGRAVRYVLAGR